MGRGRAKAKQTKVARDLKYNTPHTDFSALQAELGRSNVIPVDDESENIFSEDDQSTKYYEEKSDED